MRFLGIDILVTLLATIVAGHLTLAGTPSCGGRLSEAACRFLQSVIILSHIEVLDIGYQYLVILCTVKYFTHRRVDKHCRVHRARSPLLSVNILSYIETFTSDYQCYGFLSVRVKRWAKYVCHRKASLRQWRVCPAMPLRVDDGDIDRRSH